MHIGLGLTVSAGFCITCLCAAAGAADAAEGDYRFDGSISRPVLENYLSRAITMLDLCTGSGNVDDNIRMLTQTDAKFAGRTVYAWGHEHDLERKLKRARDIAAKIHAADPDMILQAAVFEIVTPKVETLAVPAWVFEAFGLEPETRNFDYKAMLFANGTFVDKWVFNKDYKGSVPDMSRLETRMWFYYLARRYIDAGMEAIHFGQVALIGRNDPEKRHWLDVLTRCRNYAKKKARRHLLLCDAHTPHGGPVIDGQTLFDFHSFPLRIKDVVDKPQQGILEVGFSDSLYQRSNGGVTPSGWSCEHLPYLVELDNWGRGPKEGQGDPHSPWAWGYDEISWFARQPEAYRNQWLRYAWTWVREHDPAGFLQMPGSRCVATPTPDGKRWYRANTASEACPDGYGQETTIREIWATE